MGKVGCREIVEGVEGCGRGVGSSSEEGEMGVEGIDIKELI